MKTWILLLLASSLFGADFDQKHTAWDQWLKTYATVQGPVTKVNYLKAKQDMTGLEAYLKSVEAVPQATFLKWSTSDRLAFLINAYNAFTVKLILDHYPVKSIKDIGSIFKSAWKKSFFTLFGEENNLDGIEHGIIRKNFSEPRIHFAVVCASKGCPALRGEAYVGPKLEEQLESSTQAFLKDTTRNRYDAVSNKLSLSKIFDWYEGDFKKPEPRTVQDFVADRLTSSTADRAKMHKAEIEHLDYDWTLNE